MTKIFIKGETANTMPKRRDGKSIYFYKYILKIFYKFFTEIITPLLPKNNFKNYKSLTLLQQVFSKIIVRKFAIHSYLNVLVMAAIHILEETTRNPKKTLAYCITNHATRGLSIGVETDSFTTNNIILTK